MSWLIPEWLLALALTLFVVDLFTDEEGDELWPVANPPAGAADGQAAEATGMKDGQVVLKD